MHPFTRRLASSGVLIIGLLPACVTTNATRLGNGAARPFIPSTQVAIYRTADQVPGRYEEVAVLNSTGTSQWTNEAQMFENMRQKAGQMGANAVILDGLSEPGAGAKVAAAIFRTTTERKGRAIAVYVFPEGVVPTTAASAPAATGAAGAIPASRPASPQTPPSVSPPAPAALHAEYTSPPTEPQVASSKPVRDGAAVGTAKSQEAKTGSADPKRVEIARTVNGTSATALIGAPSSEDARVRAVDAYRDGRSYFGRHEWGKAEAKFREALRLDGSVAAYHGALGSVLLVLGRWVEAEATLSAAVLLDVNNVRYREMLLEARSHQ